MKEKNIRPKDLMDECDRLHAEDVKQIMKHKDRFVEISCPACENKKYKVIFKKDDFSFVECKNCATVFINPRPPIELLTEFYNSYMKLWNDKIFPTTEKYRRANIFVPRAKKVVELCQKHKAPVDILVDVGAGFGTFCEEIKKMSIFNKVMAVEPSANLAESCRQKGIEIINKPIEEINLSQASVITNFELLEHLFWPKDFLFACYKALSYNGLFILTTPNIKGFDLMFLGKLSDSISGPEHLNYFHPQSLSYLLKQCGFEVVEVLTPGKLDAELVRKEILAGSLDISPRPFLKYVLIDKWEELGSNFQQFLADNKLSSHLWIVARKI